MLVARLFLWSRVVVELVVAAALLAGDALLADDDLLVGDWWRAACSAGDDDGVNDDDCLVDRIVPAADKNPDTLSARGARFPRARPWMERKACAHVRASVNAVVTRRLFITHWYVHPVLVTVSVPMRRKIVIDSGSERPSSDEMMAHTTWSPPWS